MPNNTLHIGEAYNFISLQTALSNQEKGTFFVLQQELSCKTFYAVMHIIGANLTGFIVGDIKYGDAVLFYSDGDFAQADDDDKFRLMAICHPKQFVK